ncbi:MAG: AAA family ATPase [Chitinivibrionales bacterium]|nr:AAA family ATPase [Chitinivibrionales bacterium]
MCHISERQASGAPGLDQVLYGGFAPNQMCLIQGYSGTGKTTLCLQFLLEGARRGQRSLYISTSETLEETREIAHSHNWSLDGVELRHHPVTGSDEPVRPGPSQTMLHPAEVELPHIIESLITDIGTAAPERVVIDSLSEIRLLAREDAWYQRQLMALKRFFQACRCTVLLTDTVVEKNSVLETIVGTIIRLSTVDTTYGPIRRRLLVDKRRAYPYASGYHDYRIETGGMRVFPRLSAPGKAQEGEPGKVTSGIAALDALLGGGLDRGSSTLVVGQSGTGKSSLVMQFALACAERERGVLVYCFDERQQSYIERAKGLGMDIEGHMREERILLRTIEPAELSAGEFSDLVARTVDATCPCLVIIDSLDGYAYALPNEKYLSVHLHELTSYLAQKNIVTLSTLNRTSFGEFWCVIHPRLGTSYVADTVMDLRFFEFRGAVRKLMSLHKRRSGPHELTVRELWMDATGLHVSPVIHEFDHLTTATPRYFGESLPEVRTFDNHGES